MNFVSQSAIEKLVELLMNPEKTPEEDRELFETCISFPELNAKLFRPLINTGVSQKFITKNVKRISFCFSLFVTEEDG